MKNKKIRTSSLLAAIGISLIVLSCLSVVVSSVSQRINAKKATELAEELKTLIPDSFNAFPDGRSNSSMPTAEIDGVDFAGIIEIPVCNVALPIRAEWKKAKVASYPCRLSGSTYSCDLIIGGSDNAGMFDFFKLISPGDYVFVTDMSGAAFTYRISEITETNDPDADNLSGEDSDLVLFAKNTFSYGYTVVRCKIAQ